MEQTIDRLILLIKNEETILKNFLECLNRQKEFITQNKIDEFDSTVKEEELLISKIRDLEKGRIELVRQIASRAGSIEDELNLTRLIEMNLEESSDELKILKRTLAELVERIKKANRINQYLIKRSLSFIQKNIDWFIDDSNLNVTYQQDGSQQLKTPGNLLVNKVF
ncbi:flagellar protein FlgN [bacterium]|nr:flagellar protein FlgN [bacterium]